MASAVIGPFIVLDDWQSSALSHGGCRTGLARHDGGRVPAKSRRIRPMKVRILQYPKDLAKSISNQVITSSHINPEALGMIVKVVRTFRTGT